MKPSRLLQLLFAAGTISLFPLSSVLASSFGETEVDRNQFAVVAAPYRHGYNLLILEQIPGQRPCWSETGANPTLIQPLFLEFDFTNACIRSSDSNGYSIRFNSQDYGMDYLLNVVEREGELHLVGTPRDSSKPELHLGSTNGLSEGSLKIQLKPGWRLTKRNYNGTPTKHVYISNSPETQRQFVSQSVSQNETNNQQPPVNYPTQQPTGTVYQQPPVSYPTQQPTGTVYQQPPVSYPTQQPTDTVYQQPAVNYPTQQPTGTVYQQPAVNYPTQQPTGTVYQQPAVNYPTQQPTGTVYQQPAVNYPTQQPTGNVYQQPAVNYPTQQPTGTVF